ncbi:MAG TPA: hypothetical protein VGB66_03405 [Longimicrobium sp.]|jgi:hypothetical protein
MRIVQDGQGRTWDVLVGRGSWGSLVILFSLRGDNQNRTADLASETVRQAEQEVAALSDDELRARLAESKPWEG